MAITLNGTTIIPTPLVTVQTENEFKENGKVKEKEKEKGCTEPLYGEKSKCVLKIIPVNERGPTFTIDNKCVKRRKDQ